MGVATALSRPARDRVFGLAGRPPVREVGRQDGAIANLVRRLASVMGRICTACVTECQAAAIEALIVLGSIVAAFYVALRRRAIAAAESAALRAAAQSTRRTPSTSVDERPPSRVTAGSEAAAVRASVASAFDRCLATARADVVVNGQEHADNNAPHLAAARARRCSAAYGGASQVRVSMAGGAPKGSSSVIWNDLLRARGIRNAGG